MGNFTLIGRLVQGDPHKQQPPSKDPRTKQVKVDPKTGQPVQGQFFVAVAIAKNPAQRFTVAGLPTYEQTKAELDANAKAAWPQFFGQPAAGLQIGPELPAGCTNPKFANKIIDGDGFDENGQPYSAKEGYAGHWVVKCASYYAPKVYEWTPTGWQETVRTGRTIKCGDYISVTGNDKTNGSDQSPGMYMNLDGVTFEKEGPEIVSTGSVDPNDRFGSRGGNAAHAGNASGGAATTQSSATAGAGNYSGYMDTDTPPPPGDDAPPPPSGPVMTEKAAGKPYESFTAKGWTDAQLRANGYIV